MREIKRHIQRDGLKGATHLEVSVYYSKGGMSCLTGKTSPRGYYISVRPVTLGNGMVSYMLFSGKGQFLFEANRFTEKQLDKAVEMAKSVEDELVSAVVAENQAA